MIRSLVHKLLLLTLSVTLGLQPLKAEVQSRVDSLLNRLDRTIEEQELHLNRKHQRIADLKQQMAETDSSQQRERIFGLCRDLRDEYIPFKFDSAFHYATSSLKLAQEIGDMEAGQECKIQLANILMTGGLFDEALKVLDSLNSRQMTPELQALLYSTYDLTYLHRAKFMGGDLFTDDVQAIRRAYIDSLAQVATVKAKNYRMLSRLYIEREGPSAAKAPLLQLLDSLDEGTRAHAIVTGSLAYCYEMAPEGELRKEYLIRSAISDLEGAVRENESLRQLAYLLFKEGDINRAHTYISISINDANFYNARLRCIEAASTYPIIQEAYRETREAHLKRLNLLIITSVLLLIASSFIGIMLLNRIKALNRTRSALAESNEELRKLNELLTDANGLKQEQVNSFLVLCSSYINKLERQQAKTNNLLSLGKVAQLKELVSSSQMINEEIREFYHTFDRMVLKLYPNFVHRVNELLREPERIQPLDDGLTTELRIYALICLGITDSAQIARFLRYSSNTVYTYRTKMRNKAIDKTRFDEDVRAIGLY